MPATHDHSVELTVWGVHPNDLIEMAYTQAARYFDAYYHNGEIDKSALTVTVGTAHASQEIDASGGRQVTLWEATARVEYK